MNDPYLRIMTWRRMWLHSAVRAVADMERGVMAVSTSTVGAVMTL